MMNRQFRFNKKLIDALPPHPEDAKAKVSEYSDTEVAGLRIIVNRRGRKYFLFIYSFDGAKRSTKLGDYPQMDVGNARQRALDCRRQVATGTDPQAAAATSAAARLTLREFVTNDYLPHAYAVASSGPAWPTIVSRKNASFRAGVLHCELLFLWIVHWKRWMLRTSWRIYMMAAVIVTILTFWFWTWLNISRHIFPIRC